jgi:hypothetical protein
MVFIFFRKRHHDCREGATHMQRAFLPKALALTVLAAGLTMAGAQQSQSAPDPATQAPTGYHHHHAPNPQRQAEFISKKFNLSPDQTAKLEPILATRDQQIRAIRDNAQLDPQDRHQQMRAINQQTEQQLSTVLSPDQLSQLKAMRHRGGRWHHGQNGDAPQAPSA